MVQGYTLVVLMVTVTTTQTLLPDFMFGWSAAETRTQTGQLPSGGQMGARPTKADITRENLLRELIFQGDIKLRLDEAREILEAMSGGGGRRRRKRKITAFRDKRWDIPIPYRYDNSSNFTSTEKASIQEAISHWETRTCITFTHVPDDVTVEPVLFFIRRGGCWSFVGKEKAFKKQEISIGERCFSLGVLVHELGHAIGFWHEHSRPDRDEHIRVRYENIENGEDYNFMKETWREVDNLDVAYDIGSVMHYSSTAFSSNGQVTVETLKSLDQGVLGQRQTLSFYDAKQANLAYCNDTCVNSPIVGKCKNEGYPDPNDCSRCRCPDGLAGSTCTSVAPSVGESCGGVIQILGDESYTIVTPGYPYKYKANVECNWLIKARTNTTVVKLAPISDSFMAPQPSCYSIGGTICDEEYVEIKYRVSLAKTGARFCCGNSPTTVIQSEGNSMMVLFRTKNPGNGGFKFIVSSESCGGCMENSPSDQPACMEQKREWCPKKWTYMYWVTCPSFFIPVGYHCGFYQNRTAYRKGFCQREKLKCCGNFQLSGNRCVLSTPGTEKLITTTLPTTTTLASQGSGVAIGNDLVDSGWSEWSAWSDCSHTCGGCGTRSRKRTCFTQSTDCSPGKEDQQTSSCNADLCPASYTYYCQKKTMKKEACMFWSSQLCTRYEMTVEVCSTECCPGYSKQSGKCVKDKS